MIGHVPILVVGGGLIILLKSSDILLSMAELRHRQLIIEKFDTHGRIETNHTTNLSLNPNTTHLTHVLGIDPSQRVRRYPAVVITYLHGGFILRAFSLLLFSIIPDIHFRCLFLFFINIWMWVDVLRVWRFLLAVRGVLKRQQELIDEGVVTRVALSALAVLMQQFLEKFLVGVSGWVGRVEGLLMGCLLLAVRVVFQVVEGILAMSLVLYISSNINYKFIASPRALIGIRITHTLLSQKQQLEWGWLDGRIFGEGEIVS